jgi:hypothetical protein
MEPDWWLEVDNTYISRIAERKNIFKEHGKNVLDYLPGSELACKEIMEMCLQFYCSRYPAYFSLSADKTTFCNELLKETTEIKSMHPLLVILNNVPEDFAIVLRNEKDGMYYFRAGVICSSVGWHLGTKIGKQLRDIHKPVPDYEDKMSLSMDRYFSKMPSNGPIQRGSWEFSVGKTLFIPPGHLHETFSKSQIKSLRAEDCYLRVHWQTLRRAPLSGAIVFNFKTLFTPIEEFRDEPYIPALLLRIIKEGKRSLIKYKNTWHVEHACIPKLEEFANEQLARQLIPSEILDQDVWNVKTLEESPYFPGWEEKWHQKQGF